jgi:hypothetical protein
MTYVFLYVIELPRGIKALQIAMGREGFEPSTLGSKVQPNKPRQAEGDPNVLHLRTMVAATSCSHRQSSETSLYVILYVMFVGRAENAGDVADQHCLSSVVRVRTWPRPPPLKSDHPPRFEIVCRNRSTRL